MARRSIDSVLAERRAEDPVGFQRISFLNGVRRALKRLRGDVAQTELAKRSGRGQSEISRLESAVTEHTRLGTLIDYAQACGGSLMIGLRDQNGSLVSMLDSKMTSEQVAAAAVPTPAAIGKDVALGGAPMEDVQLTDREAMILALLAKAKFNAKFDAGQFVKTLGVAKNPRLLYDARLSKAMAVIEDPKAKLDLEVVQLRIAKLAKRFANVGDIVDAPKVR